MKRTACLAALLVLTLTGSALADGFIVVRRHPPGRPEIRNVPLAVKYHRVKVTIEGQVATTEIDQVFINPNPRQLEGTYIFPLPETASISGFSMWIDGKEQKGELLEKDKARKIYTDIVRSMKDPALLEYVGRDMFKASIFPIPARGEKRVRLMYQEICRADGGLVTYRYPLNTEKFSSRPLQDVSVLVDIKAKSPVKNVTCPTHKVEVITKSANHVRVGYEDKNVTPDRDLLLYYSLSKKEFALNFLTYRPEQGADGYFMMLLSPNLTVDRIVPKNICFVVDKSGSMQGAKIKQARAALKFCVQSLREGDRFNVIPFGTEAETLFGSLEPATADNVKRATEFIGRVEAIGGTAIDEALSKALEMAPQVDQPYMIVFLTDGLPTIGETREEVILANVARRNKGNVRLFVFGVGNDVNTHLLDKLAESNHGSRDYVAENEDLELKISSFYTKVANPVLSDLALAFTGVRVRDVYPKRLPDLFKGSQLVVVGRYEGSGSGAAQLTGKILGEKKVIGHDVSFGAKVAENSFLSRLWAIRKCGYLLDQIRLHGEKKELKDEIVRLAKLHGIVTPYTSFLVLEDQEHRRRFTRRGDRFGPPPPSTPGSRPRDHGGSGPGWAGGGGRGGGGGGGDPRPAADAPMEEEDEAFRTAEKKALEEAVEGMRRSTGGKSVDASKETAKLKGGLVGDADDGYVPDAGREASKQVMRLVESTAFYKRGKVWVQAKLPKDAERKTVKLFSEEHFALLAKKGRIGKVLALGQVDFLLDGVVYQVR